MKRIYNKANPKPKDPNIELLNSLKLSKEIKDFVQKKLESFDKKTLALFKCYTLTKDAADLENSITRLI